MPRLKNRQLQVPGGLHFYLPQTKWRSRPNSSFDTIARELQHVIKANPALAKKHGWKSDIVWVEDWVDLYNATLCLRNGWNNYILEEGGGGPVANPKVSPRSAAHLAGLRDVAAAAKLLLSGARALKDWDSSGDPPVPAEQSAERARTCASCPHNTEGDFTRWFTISAAELIKRRVEAIQKRGLSTPLDGQLNLCDVCMCPLKLKVHVPIAYVTGHLPPEVLRALLQVNNCWVKREHPK